MRSLVPLIFALIAHGASSAQEIASTSVLEGPAESVQLLHATAAHLSRLTDYEMHEAVRLDVPGTPWSFGGEMVLFGPHREVMEDGTTKLRHEGWSLGGLKLLGGVERQEHAASPQVSTPFAISYPFFHSEKHALRVERIGSESVRFNAKEVSCEILRVFYPAATYEHWSPEEVTLWIDPEQKLILGWKMKASAGRTIPLGVWTVKADSAEFHKPPPKWLVDTLNTPPPKLRPEWTGKDAPEVALRDARGTMVRLSELRGTVVLLDFWSITCPPCKQELPMLEQVAGDYNKKPFMLLGVSFDPSNVNAAWLEKNHHELRTLSDPEGKVSDAYGVGGIPDLVLIGKDGKVRRYWIGEVAEDELRAAIVDALQ